MKQKVLKLAARAALVTARKAGNAASYYGFYQPKEPKNLNKKNNK